MADGYNRRAAGESVGFRSGTTAVQIPSQEQIDAMKAKTGLQP